MCMSDFAGRFLVYMFDTYKISDYEVWKLGILKSLVVLFYFKKAFHMQDAGVYIYFHYVSDTIITELYVQNSI